MAFYEGGELSEQVLGDGEQVADIEMELRSDIWSSVPSSLLDVIKSKNENVGKEVRSDPSLPITGEMVNYHDANYKTCLHWAVSNESIDWVEYLLKHVCQLFFRFSS